MRRFQFSLRALFLLTTGTALACAALAQATAGWCVATRLAVTGALLAAVVGSLVRTGPSRSFWIGMAAFGWGYLVITNGLTVRFNGPQALPPHDDTVTGWLYERMHGPWPDNGMGGGGFMSLAYQAGDGEPDLVGGFGPVGGIGGLSPFPDFEMAARFLDIAEWLFVLVMAGTGGVLGRTFYALNRKEADGG